MKVDNKIVQSDLRVTYRIIEFTDKAINKLKIIIKKLLNKKELKEYRSSNKKMKDKEKKIQKDMDILILEEDW